MGEGKEQWMVYSGWQEKAHDWVLSSAGAPKGTPYKNQK